MSIGSGGGLSLYEPEPSYQQGVQSTGSRTTPDVSMVADPATGAWIADTYNLDPSNPFEVVGGTSLSAPAFAGLIALVDQGRVTVGEAVLNSSSPTETQQALYSLPQADYNVIANGSNGYTANLGYNLVTGLGTPVANLLVPDLVAYQGPGTTYAGPTVGPLQDATLSGTWEDSGGTPDVFGIFDAITMSSHGLDDGQRPEASSTISTTMSGTPAQGMDVTHGGSTLVTSSVTTLGPAPGLLWQNGPAQAIGEATNSALAVQPSPAPVTITITAVSTGGGKQEVAWFGAQTAAGSPVDSHSENPGGSPATDREGLDGLILSRPRTRFVSDAALDEMADDVCLWSAQRENGRIKIPVVPIDRVAGAPAIGDPLPLRHRPSPAAYFAAGLAVLSLSADLLARGTGLVDARKRPFGRVFSRRKSDTPW